MPKLFFTQTLYLAKKYGSFLLDVSISEDDLVTLSQSFKPKNVSRDAEGQYTLQEAYDNFVRYVGAYMSQENIFNLNERLLQMEGLVGGHFGDDYLRNASLARSFLAFEARLYNFGKNLAPQLITASNESLEDILRKIQLPEALKYHYKNIIIHWLQAKKFFTPADIARHVGFHLLQKLVLQDLDKIDQSQHASISKKLQVFSQCNYDFSGNFAQQIDEFDLKSINFQTSNYDVVKKQKGLADDVARHIETSKSNGLLKEQALIAASENDLDKLKQLDFLGLDLCHVIKDTRTLLHFSVQNQGEETVSYLLNLPNYDPNTAIPDTKETALHLAVKLNSLKLVGCLLQCQAIDVNLEDLQKWTPLHWAGYLGYTAIAEKLILAGADFTLKTSRKGVRTQQTAIDLAKSAGFSETANQIQWAASRIEAIELKRISGLEYKVIKLEEELQTLKAQFQLISVYMHRPSITDTKQPFRQSPSLFKPERSPISTQNDEAQQNKFDISP